MGTVSAGDGGEPGRDVRMGDLVDPHRVQRPEIRAGEIELGNPVRDRAQLIPLEREIDVGHLGEGALSLHPLRRLLGLRILPKRGAGEDLAGALAGLCWSQPLSCAEREAPSPTIGAVLRDVGAPAPLQPQPEARELGVPRECLVLVLAESEGTDSLGIQLQLHGSLCLGST